MEWEDPHDSSLYCIQTDGNHMVASGSSYYGVVRLWDKRQPECLQVRTDCCWMRCRASLKHTVVSSLYWTHCLAYIQLSSVWWSWIGSSHYPQPQSSEWALCQMVENHVSDGSNRLIWMHSWNFSVQAPQMSTCSIVSITEELNDRYEPRNLLLLLTFCLFFCSFSSWAATLWAAQCTAYASTALTCMQP